MSETKEEGAAAEKSTVQSEEPQTNQTASVQAQTASFSLDQARELTRSSVSSMRDYSPFIFGIGRQILLNGACGLALGLVFTRSSGVRRGMFFFGAGVGLGQSLPTVGYLCREFTKDAEDRDGRPMPMFDDKVHREIDLLEKEVVLRSRLKH